MNKLVLFDIDGTLIKGDNKKHRLSFCYVFKKVYGVDATIDVIDHPGKTDTQIILEVLKKKGLDEQFIRSKINEAIKEMAAYFKKSISEDKFVLFEGANAMLEELNKNNILLGLVTGNLEPIARAKLKNANVNDYFKLGGFGSDDDNRANLVWIAIKRAEDSFGFKFNNNVFLIGDTPRDIKAGKEAGVKIIAISTGPYSWQELKDKNPDFLFKSLTFKEEILNVILS